LTIADTIATKANTVVTHKDTLATGKNVAATGILASTKLMKIIAASAGVLAFVGPLMLAGAAAIIAGSSRLRPSITVPSVTVPGMATGGVVSAPTMTLVGEGRYPEAVVPLGSSPQFASMKTDIANAVVQGIMALNGTTKNRSSNSVGSNEIVLNVDGTRLARVMLPRLSNEQKRTGHNVTLREV